jgi:hypothetical protein
MAHVDVNRVYMVSVVHPGSLNDPSLAKAIPFSNEWYSKDAATPPREVKTLHRHIGLVVQYDAISHVAVIFLGTTRPRHPRRYVPWQGTPRLAYQTTESLDIQGGRFSRAGHLNFTHALRCLVIQPNEVSGPSVPGYACVTDIAINHEDDVGLVQTEVLNIFLDDLAIQKLKNLHYSYWNGVRYSKDGDAMEARPSGSNGRRFVLPVPTLTSHLNVTNSQVSGSGSVSDSSNTIGSEMTIAEKLFTCKIEEALFW